MAWSVYLPGYLLDMWEIVVQFLARPASGPPLRLIQHYFQLIPGFHPTRVTRLGFGMYHLVPSWRMSAATVILPRGSSWYREGHLDLHVMCRLYIARLFQKFVFLMVSMVETVLTAVVFKGDMAQYTPWRWHRNAETCRCSNLMVVFYEYFNNILTAFYNCSIIVKKLYWLLWFLKVTWLNTHPEAGTGMLKPHWVAILRLYFTQIVRFVGE
jgi:hypothetical protein